MPSTLREGETKATRQISEVKRGLLFDCGKTSSLTVEIKNDEFPVVVSHFCQLFNELHSH
jgi:hypothetical protein